MEYQLIYLPLVAMILTQIIKMVLNGIKGRFTWKDINGYGGMPSSHSSLAAATVTIIYLEVGLGSPLFVLALTTALVIVWDAFTTRHQIGFQGNIINKLIKELPDKKEYKYPLLNERTGHKFSEVIVGIIIGIVLAYLLF